MRQQKQKLPLFTTRTRVDMDIAALPRNYGTENSSESQDRSAFNETAGTCLPCPNEEISFLQRRSWNDCSQSSATELYADKPNQKWVTDKTEFSLFGDKLYLSPILDLYSSDLVSYTISDRPVLSMVTSMLDKAFEQIPDGTNLILHFRPRLAVPAQAIPTNPQKQGCPAEHEPQGKLSGQCSD